jgi:hypothetical protein
MPQMPHIYAKYVTAAVVVQEAGADLQKERPAKEAGSLILAFVGIHEGQGKDDSRPAIRS